GGIGLPVRLRGAEPASASRRGECAAVAGVQFACQGFYDCVLWGGLRPVYRVLSPAAIWEAGSGSRLDGAVSAAGGGFGGAERDQYGDGDAAGLRAGGFVGGADGRREERVLSGV